MMGLFCRPWKSLQFVALGLGSWALLVYGANAEDRPAKTTAFVHCSDSVTRVEETDTRLGIPVIRVYKPELSAGSKLGLEKVTDDACSHQGMQKPAPQLSYRQAKSFDLSKENEEDDETEPATGSQTDADLTTDGVADDELGILRLRSQPVGIDSELGVLRIRPTEDVPLEVEPEPTRQTSVFLTGRANVYGGNNLFRTPDPIDDRIYQTGVGLFAFPRLSESTNLVLSVEGNLARYEDLSVVDYNELQFQAGIRQRLSKKSYGQLNWRYQDLNTPGSDSFFTADYIELLLSRRDILNNRTWLDSYYQARLSMSHPKAFSRFTQIATGSLNYGFDVNTRASLLYQLFIDDYTEISRHDTYHQIIAQFSHDLSSTTRLSVFTGFRFGRSSLSSVNFDDTIYGASINVNLPLF